MRTPTSLLMLASLAGAPALAQTVYSWEDAQGIHYTDDPSSVPAKARKVEKARYDEGPQVSVTKPAVLAKVDAPSEPAPASAPAQPADDQERLWRGKFIDVHRRLAYLKDSLQALEGSTPSPVICNLNRICSPNPEYGRVRALIAEQTAQLRDAERELEQLDRDASYQSVPREWRRGF